MISIVICTFNGKARIQACLEAVLVQDQSIQYELIVVDNASTDGSGEFIANFLNLNLQREIWQVVEEKTPGLLSARIAGLKASKYNWVLFCDDDNILFPDFLSTAVPVLQNNEYLGVLGSLGIPKFQGGKPDWFEKYASSYAVGAQLQNKTDFKKLRHVYGACSIYRKDILLQMFERGFEPALSGRKSNKLSSGDDVEWCWLMQLMGYQIEYSEQLRFYHQIPESRLSWEYYLRLKEGIASSTGLLSTYKLYFEQNIRSKTSFELKYFGNLTKANLLYFKHRIRLGSNPERPEEQLALIILKSQKKAYLHQWKQARNHFQQIINHFES